VRPRDIERLLDQTATLKRSTGLDRFGNPSGATSTTIRCRVERKQRRTVTSFVGSAATFGEEVLSDTTVVTMTEVRPGDVLLIDGETRERRVVNVQEAGTPDRRGPRVYEVML
jgi:hypothetical protein